MKSLYLNWLLITIAVFSFAFWREVSFSASVNVSASIPSVCGNNVFDAGEQCEGSNLGGQTCVSLGYSSGDLSCSASCIFNTAQCVSAPHAPPSGGGGGGGGGGYYTPPISAVVLRGKAYPASVITIIKDGQIAGRTVGRSDGNFEATLSVLGSGSYIFGVHAEDRNRLRSPLFTFLVYIPYGSVINVSDIFIAPTTALDRKEVSQGDSIAVFGQSFPNSEITIAIALREEVVGRLIANSAGDYFYNLNTSPFQIGQYYYVKARAFINNETSPYGASLGFLVGQNNVLVSTELRARADLNGDRAVNIIDFSIAAYWYKRPAPPPAFDLNSDGKVDLADFSIMAYYWTG